MLGRKVDPLPAALRAKGTGLFQEIEEAMPAVGHGFSKENLSGSKEALVFHNEQREWDVSCKCEISPINAVRLSVRVLIGSLNIRTNPWTLDDFKHVFRSGLQ